MELLELKIFDYKISKDNKVNTVNNIWEYYVSLAIEAKEELTTELREEYIKQFSEKDRQRLSWMKQAEAYYDFRSDIAIADNYIMQRRIYKGSKDEVITPEWIVRQEVDMLPKKVFNSQSKFIDGACKTGVYLKCIIDKFMSDDPELPINSEDKYKDKHKRLRHLITKQLYGICLSRNGFMVSNKRIIEAIEFYEDKLTDNIFKRNPLIDILEIPNIIFIENYVENVKMHSSTLKDIIKRKFNMEGEDELKFDVVLGNPPYNYDLYIDFIQFGCDIASQYTMMITPAKWQVKNNDKNERFRKDIVPFMEK